jgi:hypothetical protein
VVEGARLESVYRGNSIEGSNPSLSAIKNSIRYGLTWADMGQEYISLCISPCLFWRDSASDYNCKG